MWRARHQNTHFHFTPAHAIKRKQVEFWFSILSAEVLHNSSFASLQQEREAIKRIVEVHYQTAHSFEWTQNCHAFENHEEKLMCLNE